MTPVLDKPYTIDGSDNMRSWAISVESKHESRSRGEQHHTYACLSRGQREEADQRSHEVNDFSEVPSPDAAGTIDKNTKIHTRSAN